MTSQLIILRPEPGATATAQCAKVAGWVVTKLPLFEIAPLDWVPPDPDLFDAILMTSANCARLGGPELARYHHLPLYAVGAQTAQSARKAGFEKIIAGEAGALEMADRLRADSMARIFHPCGNPTRPFDEDRLGVTHIAVYAANRVTPPDLVSALSANAVLLVHSPRSARYLDELCTAQAIARDTLSLVAISTTALAEAGQGWRRTLVAERPTDDAMVTAASSLGGADLIG